MCVMFDKGLCMIHVINCHVLPLTFIKLKSITFNRVWFLGIVKNSEYKDKRRHICLDVEL